MVFAQESYKTLVSTLFLLSFGAIGKGGKGDRVSLSKWSICNKVRQFLLPSVFSLMIINGIVLFPISSSAFGQESSIEELLRLASDVDNNNDYCYALSPD
jgi:hypothetical protein